MMRYGGKFSQAVNLVKGFLYSSEPITFFSGFSPVYYKLTSLPCLFAQEIAAYDFTISLFTLIVLIPTIVMVRSSGEVPVCAHRFFMKLLKSIAVYEALLSDRLGTGSEQ